MSRSPFCFLGFHPWGEWGPFGLLEVRRCSDCGEIETRSSTHIITESPPCAHLHPESNLPKRTIYRVYERPADEYTDDEIIS